MTDDSADTRDGTMFHPRRLSIIVFSLFFSWMLAFPFEGRILYALAEYHRISAHPFVFGAIISHFAGLLLSGFLIRTVKRAKILMLFSISFCILVSCIFFTAFTFMDNRAPNRFISCRRLRSGLGLLSQDGNTKK